MRVVGATTLVLLLGVGMVSGADLERWPSPGVKGWSLAVKAGRFVHVSALSATGADARASGDIEAQTRVVLDRLQAALRAAGTSLSRAASIQVFLRRAADFQAMNAVYATYWTADPPVRTTIVGDLLHPDSLVEMSAVGLMPDAERTVIHPAGWIKSPNPYSYGIRSGDTLFLAGLVSRNGRDNTVVQGDITEQTRTVLENGAAILAAAGMSLSDVVSSRVFIAEGAVFPAMNAAYRGAFPGQPPVRATVICGLMNPAYLVEITMVAVAGAGRTVVAATTTDGSPRQQNPNLSPAIAVAGRVFLSGMLGANHSNLGNVASQARETLSALGRLLNAAGTGWARVTDAVVYVTDTSRIAEVEAAWREVFPGVGPARTVVGTGLVAPDGLVEIMVSAIR